LSYNSLIIIKSFHNLRSPLSQVDVGRRDVKVFSG
jgi:hypothetical protein